MKEIIVTIDEDNVPAAFVEDMLKHYPELIRCKNCKHCLTKENYCFVHGDFCEADEFCSYGKRKVNEDVHESVSGTGCQND